MNPVCERDFMEFGEKRLDHISWTFAPATQPAQKQPHWFVLALYGLVHFVVIFGVVTALWLIVMTGGVSAADIRAIAHEIVSHAG